MHELSLVEELVEVCASRSGGRPVSLVRVRHASTLPEESLRQAFEMLTREGPLADAVLQAEPVPHRLECACGFSGDLGHDDVIGASMAACPACGEVRQLPSIAELELLEVRLVAAHLG